MVGGTLWTQLLKNPSSCSAESNFRWLRMVECLFAEVKLGFKSPYDLVKEHLHVKLALQVLT